MSVSYTHLDVYKRQILPFAYAAMAQQAEHVLGKDEVTRSKRVSSSKKELDESLALFLLSEGSHWGEPVFKGHKRAWGSPFHRGRSICTVVGSFRSNGTIDQRACQSIGSLAGDMAFVFTPVLAAGCGLRREKRYTERANRLYLCTFSFVLFLLLQAEILPLGAAVKKDGV